MSSNRTRKVINTTDLIERASAIAADIIGTPDETKKASTTALVIPNTSRAEDERLEVLKEELGKNKEIKEGDELEYLDFTLETLLSYAAKYKEYLNLAEKAAKGNKEELDALKAERTFFSAWLQDGINQLEVDPRELRVAVWHQQYQAKEEARFVPVHLRAKQTNSVSIKTKPTAIFFTTSTNDDAVSSTDEKQTLRRHSK